MPDQHVTPQIGQGNPENAPFEKTPSVPPAIHKHQTLYGSSSSPDPETRKRPEQPLYSPLPFQTDKPLVGDSRATKRVSRLVERAARTDRNLLVRGESGTGKSLVAKKVHFQSERSKNWLAVFDCRLAQSDVLRGFLERLVNSDPDTAGLRHVLSGGTLVFDHIEALRPDAQGCLNHVVGAGTAKRTAPTSLPSDIRVISTVNASLGDDTFDRALYDRLGQFSVCIPPLRSRPEDISALARHFLEHQSARGNTASEMDISDEAREQLAGYHWPGNVRELKYTMEQAAEIAEESVLREEDIVLSIPDCPSRRRAESTAETTAQQTPTQDASESSLPSPADADGAIPTIEEMKREAVKRAYEACDGNVDHAAVELGIGRSTMYRLLKRYDVMDDSE